MKKNSFFSALILSIKVWASVNTINIKKSFLSIFFAACFFITSLFQPTFLLAAVNNNLSSLNKVALEKGSKVSTDATLSALTTTAGAISPVFAPGTIAYSAGVGNAQSSVTVTPTANDGGTIEVRINGGGFAAVASGNASSPLALNVGTNTIEVKVTATDGLTIITYTITVTRFNDVTITSFSPLSGPIGTAVTITGKNFNTTPSNNIVFFGAMRGTVTSASSTSLTVTVPAGLTYSRLSVLNTGTNTSAISSQFYSPTFSPNKASVYPTDFAAKVDFATSAAANFVRSADFDGDGRADLLSLTGGAIYSQRNTSTSGAPNFSTSTDIGITPSTGSFSSFTLGDLNADGKPDLVVKELEGIYVRYFLLKNTSTLGNISFEFVRSFNSTNGKLDAIIGDVDGDGLPDLVLQDYNEILQGISIWRNLSVNNDFNLEVATTPTNFQLSGNALLTALADLNGDGKLDLIAVQTEGDRKISIRQNTASPGTISAASFAAPVTFSLTQNFFDMALGDVDGDGKTDILLTGGATNGRVSIFRNSGLATIGSGFLESQVDLVAGHTPRSVAIGDLNGDGKPDITTTHQGGTSIRLFRNVGSPGAISSASFVANGDIATGNTPNYLTITDIDGDGKLDLSAVSSASAISVFRNEPIFTNAKLSSITTTAGALTPTFSSATTTYTASVSSATTTVTVTPTQDDSAASMEVRINGGSYVALGDGATSAALSLNLGNNPIDIKVTAPDGTTVKTYTITVFLPSGNANLANLTSTAGTLSPLFAANTLSYNATVSNITTTTTVTPTVAFAQATVKVNGTTVTSGNASSAIALAVGANTITTVVTAEDGTTLKTYEIIITRRAPNADLSALTISAGTLSPAFASGTIAYTANVSTANTTITVTPTVFESSSTIKVRVNGGTYATLASAATSNGLALNMGSNTIDIQVTAEDGITIKTYTITVNRLSNDADLSNLTTSLESFKPTFTSTTTAYTMSLNNFYTSLTVAPTANNANATIQVQINSGSYVAVTSGANSTSLNLNEGDNTINVKVTAQDGITVKTYTITVTRVPFVAPPTITALSAVSGPVGTTITITGTNFESTASNNTVFFGATKANIISGTGTSLVVTIPLGATYGPVSVLNTTSRLSAASKQLFNPTYSPHKLSISTADIAARQDIVTDHAARNSVVSDLDGDGKPDLILANIGAFGVSIRRNISTTGTAIFGPNIDLSIGGSVTLTTPIVTVGDLDGDSKPDLVIQSISPNQFHIFRNTSTSGSISFDFVSSTSLGDNIVAKPILTIADIDGDGRPDLVQDYPGGGVFPGIRIWQNVSAGNSIRFNSSTSFIFVTGTTTHSVSVADFNGDGKVDIAFANQSANSIYVVQNTSTAGSFTFNTPVTFSIGGTTLTNVGAADLDGDGNIDLAATWGTGVNSSLAIFRNTGPATTITTGSFATRVDFATGGTPRALAIGDIDGDGKPDLTTANFAAKNISIFRNTSTSGSITSGSFAPRVDFAADAVNSPRSISSGDIDGDGKLDLIEVNTGGIISVFLNSSVLTDASLSALTTDAGVLTPSFASGTLAYSATVSNATTTATITPVANDAAATLQVRVNAENYVSIASGATSSALNLNVGANTVDVKVTAPDGTTVKTYTVTITRISTNADLSAVALSSGSLSPTFASGTTSYTASVSNATTSITLTPTVADATATIKVNGNTVASGAASDAIALNVGDNTITTIVTAQDGTTTKTYTLTVTRAASANADLASLATSVGTLSPSFASGTTSYTASVSNATTSITVTPTVSEANATIKVNNTTVASASASGAINLNVGTNTITTVVTAQDGTTTNTYTVTVTRAASANADLASLAPSVGTLSPTFASGTTSYTASVSNATTSITVTPTVSEANATIKVNNTTVASASASGAINLNVGSNTITTVVTAQDGTTTNTYTVTVTRAASANADLASLATSVGTLSPSFASGTTTYTASVSNATTSITVTPTVSEANATIKVNNTTVASASASGAINLNVGSNTITTVVTAQDGTTTNTYTVTVTRAASANADLASLAPSVGTLSPTFASGTTSYTASVSNATTSITVTPTVSEANATIKVNNTTVASASASGAINLNVGTNTINTVVTAQDGITTKTYTLLVTRASIIPSNNANLVSLVASNRTISPIFASGNISYTSTVVNTTSAITLTPSAADNKATIKVNGIVVNSGVASGLIPLTVGNNVITIQVAAEDGVTIKTYTLTVTRETPISSFVNQSPTIDPISDQSICLTTLPQVINLTGITPGPELNQSVTLTITSSNSDLFSQLSITNNGVITYAIKPGKTGSTTLTVKVKDDGGVANGGIDEITRLFVLNVNALPVVAITSDKGNTISKGDQMVLTATGGVSYSWSTESSIISGQNSAVLTVKPLQNTTYTVTATNASGCTTSQSFSVNVVEDFAKISSVNIITPNGDGVNDFWIVNNIELYPKNEVKVIDLAGRTVFSMKSYNNSWNATVKGVPLATGTYYYIIDFDKKKTIKGYITVLK